MFQLIPIVTGPRAEMRVGWGQDIEQPEIVSDIFRMPSKAPKGLGRRVCLARPRGRRREGI